LISLVVQWDLLLREFQKFLWDLLLLSVRLDLWDLLQDPWLLLDQWDL
jgi:hypothetical protein